MNGKKLAAVLVVIVLVAGGAIYVITRTRVKPESQQPPTSEQQEYQGAPSANTAAPAPAGKETNAPQNENTAPAPTPRPAATYVVEMYDKGFIPDQLRIKVGDTVRFINKGTKPVWPASAVHPTHLVCKGFDALRGIPSGETYSYTFTEAKECPFHDHLNPAHVGKITALP